MANETNLFGLHVESRHEGYIGNFYNEMCKARYTLISGAIELIEAKLEQQLNSTQIIYKQNPSIQSTQTFVANIETYHNESNARQAVDNAVGQFEQDINLSSARENNA